MKRAARIILVSLLVAGVAFFVLYPTKAVRSSADLSKKGCHGFQASAAVDQARLLTPSALVSDRSIAFYSVVQGSTEKRTVALGYKDAVQAFHPTALLIDDLSGPAALTKIIISGGKCAAVVDRRYELSAIEQLYTLALTLDPLAQFSLAICKDVTSCLSSEKRLFSHATLLRAIAAQRQLLAAAIGLYGPSMPRWSMIEITQPERSGHDKVSIKLTGDHTAFEGATVAFSRRPHAGCIASIDAQGFAGCVIEDPHGDEHAEEEEAGPVIATYSGKVMSGITFPPTTGVIDIVSGTAVPMRLGPRP